MSKLLLHRSHLSSVHRCIPFLSPPFSTSIASLSLLHFRSRFSVSISSPSHLQSIFPFQSRRVLSVCAFESSSSETKDEEEAGGKDGIDNQFVKTADEDYPTGEFEFELITEWKGFLVKLKMLVAFPWERVRKGSVLTMKLRGQISDQIKSRFSRGLSLPQFCENFLKAAYDPRISGVYLHIDILSCGWGKLEDIRRHILNFKQSGKRILACLCL